MSAIAVAVFLTPSTPRLEWLVEELGSADYGRRELATRQLEWLGIPALPRLVEAARSTDPEVARRAGELVGSLSRKQETTRLLSATMVRLSYRDQTIESILADLTKQAGFPITTSGMTDPLRRYTLVSEKPVPFWEAAHRITELTGLYAVPISSTTLEFRLGSTPNSPIVTQGALRLSMLTSLRDQASNIYEARLRFDAEPRLKWVSTEAVRISRAQDAEGRSLLIPGSKPRINEPTPPPSRSPFVGIAVPIQDVLPARSDRSNTQTPIRVREAVFSVQAEDETVRSIARLEGVIKAKVLQPALDRVTIDELIVKPMRAISRSSSSGEMLSVTDLQAQPEGSYKMAVTIVSMPTEVQIPRPNQSFPLEETIQRDNGRMTSRRGSVPLVTIDPKVGPFRIVDEKGRPLETLGRWLRSEKDVTGRTTDTWELTIGAGAEKSVPPVALTLIADRYRTVEIPFSFDNVRIR